MKKNIQIILMLCILVLSFASCAVVSPTVLTIEGQDASLNEFNYYFSTMKLQIEKNMQPDQIKMHWQTEKDGKTAFDTLKEESYTKMIEMRVAAKKAEDMGITYGDKEKQAASTFKKQMMQVAPTAEEFYKMTNTDEATISQISKMMALRNSLITKMMETKEIEINEADVLNEFNKNYLGAKHILFKTTDDSNAPLPEDQIAAKKAKADETLKKIQAGENFDKLMSELSEDPGSKSQPDGYIFTTGQMVPEFEEGTKALEVGAVSGIVESSFGYHIIKRIPVNADASNKTYQESKEDITNSVLTEKFTAKVNEWKQSYNIIENKTEIDKIVL